MLKDLQQIALPTLLIGLGSILLYDHSHNFMHILIHDAKFSINSKEFWGLSLSATSLTFLGLVVWPASTIIKKKKGTTYDATVRALLKSISLAVLITWTIYVANFYLESLLFARSGYWLSQLFVLITILIVTLAIGNLVGVPVLIYFSKRKTLGVLKIIFVAGAIPTLIQIIPELIPESEGSLYSFGNSLGDIVVDNKITPLGWLQKSIQVLGAFSYGAFAGVLCQNFLKAKVSSP